MPRHLTTDDSPTFIPVAQKGAASGVASLGVDGKVPTAQLPSSLTTGVTSFNGLTGNVVQTAADLNAVPTAVVGQPGGVASLDGTGKVPTGQLPDLSTGFIATTQKGAANGVATLDSSTLVPVAQIPNLPASQITSGTFNTARIPDLSATYVGVAAKGVANGVATLDSGTLVPVAQIPNLPASQITSGTFNTARIPDLSATYITAAQKGAASGVATLDGSTKVPTAQIPDLSATYITAAQKGAASGVATLDSGSKVPVAQIPSLSGTYVATTTLGAASGTATLDSTSRLTISQVPLMGQYTLYVASNNATAAEKSRADYVCDGTADQVEINAALTAIRAAGGGTVLLSTGNYNLTASVAVTGANDVNNVVSVALRGCGTGVSTLTVPTTVTSGVHLSQCVIAHLSDFSVLINGGTSHGISSAASSGGSNYRSFWESSFKNLRIMGPWDGTHTGWAMHLGSPFRSVFENLEIGGVGNGIRMFSEFTQQNPGDCIMSRVFVETHGTGIGSVAYKIDSPVSSSSGFMNQMEFSMCEAIHSGTGATAIVLGGVGTVSDIHFRGINLEQYDRFLDSVYSTSCTFRFNYIQLRSFATGLTAFNFSSNSFDNHILSTGFFYADASATLYNDGNTSVPNAPNTIEYTRMYAESGVTITGTVNPAATTVRRGIASHGPGTTTGVLRYAAVDAPMNVQTLTDGATINLDASKGNHFRVTLAGNRTLAAPTNPTDGQMIRLEVIQDATGSRTLTLTTGSGGAFAYGTDITSTSLTTTANKRDIIGFMYSASAARWLVVSFVKGF